LAYTKLLSCNVKVLDTSIRYAQRFRFIGSNLRRLFVFFLNFSYLRLWFYYLY